jgi:hypothetical protein
VGLHDIIRVLLIAGCGFTMMLPAVNETKLIISA